MSNRTSIRMRVLPRFPARIDATNGLKIEQDSLDLVVKPDFGALTPVPSISNADNTFFWGWDQSLDMYSRISFQNLVSNIQSVIIGPTTAAMEATSPAADQFIYFNGPDSAAVTGLTAAGRALLDDANAAAQRATLELGTSATLNVGNTSGTVAAGDDSRIVNAVQTSRTLTAGAGLTGGGDLSANRSLALNAASIASLAKADSAVQPLTKFNARATVVRGDNISDGLWNSRIAEFENGGRGPLFIWNNPSPADYANGKNMGGQVWVGDNPTATPDSSAPVAFTVAIANGNNRETLYGLNIVAGNASIPGNATFKDGFAVGLEVNMYSGFAATVTDAFVGGSRKNGIEIYGQQGPGGRLTAAMMIGVNDTSGGVWWSEGIAVSRAVSNGLRFTRNPGGSVDGIAAFQNAAILDESGSTNVLKVANSHQALLKLDASASVDRIIDLDANPSINFFVKGKQTATTTLRIDNVANQAMEVLFSSGLSAAQEAKFSFSDRSTPKWSFIKTTANAFAIFDHNSGISAMLFDGNATNAVQIRVGGADKRIEVGAVDSGGTGYRMMRVAN